jgi:hypothetical protein
MSSCLLSAGRIDAKKRQLPCSRHIMARAASGEHLLLLANEVVERAALLDPDHRMMGQYTRDGAARQWPLGNS